MLTAVALCLLAVAGACSADGSVGCSFVETLCEEDEFCYDDGLFGRCESVSRLGAADLWRPDLDVSGAKLLESELERLWEQGYRWRHVYSQCVVRSALSAIRHGRLYDPGFCARTLRSTLPLVSDEIAMELEHLSPDDLAFIKFTPNSDLKEGATPQFADEVYFPPLDSPAVQGAFLTSGEVLSSAEDKADAAAAAAASLAALKDALKAQAMKRKAKSAEVGKEDSNETDDASTDSEDVAGVLNYLRQVAQDTASLLDENKDRYDVFIPPDVPVVETELSSDLNQRPVFTEEGIQWVPLSQGDEARAGDESVAEPAQAPAAATAAVLPDVEGGRDMGRVLNEPASLDDSSSASSPNGDGSSAGVAASATDASSSSAAMDRPPSPWESKPHGWTDSREDSLRLDGWMEFPKETLYPTGAYEGDELLDIGVRQDPAFRRPMRYDTKKPGPTYFYHEPDSSETSLENVENVRRIMMAQHQRNKMRLGTQDDVGQEDAVLDHLKEVGQANGKRHGLVPTGSKEMLEHSYRGALEAGPTPDGFYSALDSSSAYIVLNEAPSSQDDADRLVSALQRALLLPSGTFSNVRLEGNRVNFKVNPNSQNLNATTVAAKAESLADSLHQNYTIVAAGVVGEAQLELVRPSDGRMLVATLVACGTVLVLVVAGSVAYLVRRASLRSKEKLHGLAQPDTEPSQDYQDLCRQRMAAKSHESTEPVHVATQSPKRVSSLSQSEPSQPGSRSSTSSWSGEPVTSNLDISTGHMILSYMEDHLKCKDRLDREWEALCAYEADPCSTAVASLPANMKKNRYPDVLTYDHSRVILNDVSNANGSDYINASTITDHDPRNPAYIASQGPLPHTTADFWQMIWEQGSVVIVMLSRLMENGVAMCHRYWPEEGSEVYHTYEVHLVSEHIWCDDYLVRSFYLKNLKTSETRTVTQFHFLSWPDNGIPASIKAILEFRRKVNKSYRGRSCPIVVHCSDGIGRTGTYCLIDMVLNRMAKGAKEIDIAATLEHMRDQRAGMVKTKAQFEFVLMAIAEEVHAILKALSH